MVQSPADAPMALLAAIVEAYPRNPGCCNIEDFVVRMRDIYLPAFHSMYDQYAADVLARSGIQAPPEPAQLIMESPSSEE